MQKRLQKVLGCAWGATLAVACAAGQPTPGPAPVPAPGPTPPKAEMEVKDEVAHQFTPAGRRDPFTFIAINYQPPAVGPGPVGPNAGGNASAELLAKVKKDAELAYGEAEQLMMDNDSNASATKCDTALLLFKPINDIQDHPEHVILREKLLRLKKAAERLRSRQIAENDFRSLNLKITGIVAKEHNSQAIVNSQIRSKGELVSLNQDSGDLIVDDILPGQVVFIFRGYKIALPLTDSK